MKKNGLIKIITTSVFVASIIGICVGFALTTKANEKKIAKSVPYHQLKDDTELGTVEHEEAIKNYLYELYGESQANKIIEQLEADGRDLKYLDMDLDEISPKIDE